MRISYNWLKQFIKTDWKSEETEVQTEANTVE